MKKYILATIVSVFVCSVAQAHSVLEVISTDSKIAASSMDLNTAKEFSGKQIDGMMLGLKAEPVQMLGDIQPAEKEELILSEPKKLTLKGNVPEPAKIESKSKKDARGFFAHIAAAITSPVVVPIAMTVGIAAVGIAIGNDLAGPVTAVIGGILGAIAGLAFGIVMIPVSIVGNVVIGLGQLFKGNL